MATLETSEPALGAARPELGAQTKATVSVERAPRWPRGAKYRAAVQKAEGERGPGLAALRIGAAG